VAVITLAEYKAIRGITSTSQDAQISALIPIVQDEIVTFCNQDFNQNTPEENFPANLKGVAADMITFTLGGGITGGKKSESIDGYSYSLDDIGDSGYPKGIEKKLVRNRVASVVFGVRKTQYRDNRGLTPQQIVEGKTEYYVPGIVE
jgi:hypothetical protein